MATNAATTIDFRLIQAVGTVLLSTIEEEIVSMTYGMTRLLRQGVETQRSLLSSLPQGSDRALAYGDIEALIAKLTAMITDLQHRNLSVSELADRVASLEESSAKRADLVSPESSTIAVPEVRLHAIEDSLNSVELLAGGLGQQDEDLSQLNHRLSTLENLIQSLGALPEIVARQSQVLSRLDERLSRLEAKHLVDQGMSEREIEPDRVSQP